MTSTERPRVLSVLIFGATGMVGQGLLRECLLDPAVERVVTIGRAVTGVHNPKLTEVLHPDLWHFEAVEAALTGYTTCFFCLGVSSAGMSAAEYEHVTCGIALAAARALCRLNPGMTFIYVSATGADSSERGRTMWARVRGKTENALQRLPFKAAYSFRPAGIRPMHGARSRTKSYRFFYSLLKPILPWLQRIFPDYITSTEQLGCAMLAVAKHGAQTSIIEARNIRQLAENLPA